jgi:hypothetical protein
MGYGDDAIGTLAQGEFAWLGSVQNINVHRQLADRWPRDMAVRAAEMKISWKYVTDLLPYEATEGEVRLEAAYMDRLAASKNAGESQQARDEARVAAALRERRKQRDVFMQAYRDGKLRGVAFENAVKAWRRNHPHLWSEGQRGRMLYKLKQAVSRSLSKMQTSLEEVSATLRGGMATADVQQKRRLAEEVRRYEDLRDTVEGVCKS